jgi:DNA-binding XRE family transcriptional regulator
MNQIEMLRLSKNPPLRQVDLARRLDVRQSLISDLENGKTLPDLATAIALAAVLGVNVETLFFDVTDRVLWILGGQATVERTATGVNVDVANPETIASDAAPPPALRDEPAR